MKTINYVLGFLFNETLTRVLLIQKLRPDWQAGKYNGIGGKVEDKDHWGLLDGSSNALNAMIREFNEEAGLLVPREKWIHFAVKEGQIAGVETAFHVDVFVARGDIGLCYSKTDEQVEAVPVEDLGWIETVNGAGALALLGRDVLMEGFQGSLVCRDSRAT